VHAEAWHPFAQIDCQNLSEIGHRIGPIHRLGLTIFINGLRSKRRADAVSLRRGDSSGKICMRKRVPGAAPGRSFSMSIFGRLPAWTAAAFTLVAGFLLLAPTDASAQVNIEGLIRGAIGHGINGGYRGRSSSGHHSSGGGSTRGHSSDDDSADKGTGTDKTKEKDARDEDTSPRDSKLTAQKQPAGPAREVPQSVETDAPVAKTAGPSRESNDEPSFTPTR
jgi:hypothetical protein